MYAPAECEIIEVNGSLEGSPELVNTAAESDGWLFKMKVANEGDINALLSDKEYQEYVDNL